MSPDRKRSDVELQLHAVSLLPDILSTARHIQFLAPLTGWIMEKSQ